MIRSHAAATVLYSSSVKVRWEVVRSSRLIPGTLAFGLGGGGSSFLQADPRRITPPPMKVRRWMKTRREMRAGRRRLGMARSLGPGGEAFKPKAGPRGVPPERGGVFPPPVGRAAPRCVLLRLCHSPRLVAELPPRSGRFDRENPKNEARCVDAVALVARVWLLGARQFGRGL